MPARNRFFRQFFSVLTIIFIVAVIWSLFGLGETTPTQDVAISQIAKEVSDGRVEQIIVEGNKVTAVTKDKIRLVAFKEASEGLKDYGITGDKVTVNIKNPDTGAVWTTLLSVLLPFLLLGGLLYFMSRQARSGNMQAMSFGKTTARLDEGKRRTTFKDVAGMKHVKQELVEVVDFLKNPAKFKQLGAEIPRGVLLVGPAGVGKTLLAKAVAGEAGVPFYSISASEFVEMFVGVGASVTGDTPVLIRRDGQTKLLPIAEVVDDFYQDGQENFIVPVKKLETLGIERAKTGFRGYKYNHEKFNLGGSKFVNVSGVLRHRAKEIYQIHYLGGVIETTGDHSVFVREHNYVHSKRADQLQPGDILANLPHKVRSTFVPGLGTTHKVKAHLFDQNSKNLELDIWGEESAVNIANYQYALAQKGVTSQAEVGQTIGVSQATVGQWQNDTHQPRFFSNVSVGYGLPEKVIVDEDLMRLFGYYLAEGRVTPYYLEFVFGTHEPNFHRDCIELLQKYFHLPVRVEETETNSTRILVSSRPLVDFFRRHFGTGSHNKILPSFFWSLPKAHIHQLIEGYAAGDGYTTQDGKLSITSVNREMISQLAWLLAMHGVQCGIRQMEIPARVIKVKPVAASTAWNLIVGKTSNSWLGSTESKSPNQFKKPRVTKITKKPYDGYVYDLVGCENEAFYGGQKPVLLHNSRVRDLFTKAKKTAPTVIFIDELDAVGRQRGTGLGGSHDEREQTLNQILVEMDGFDTEANVIVLAATNRPDVLDPALLRPGRFDRKVVLDMPDRPERAEILAIHSKNKPLAKSVNLEEVAKSTPGLSGADLRNIANEAAILAARDSRKKIEQKDFRNSIEKVLLGPERSSHLMRENEKKIVAYHEAGHAIVGHLLADADEVHKVSIISRGMALGFTLSLPKEDNKLIPKSQFEHEIARLLGGRAAEKLIFKEVTTGAANDLDRATEIARNMVMVYGMSELGPVKLGEREEMVFLGREMGMHRVHSEKVAAKIDEEISRLIGVGWKTAVALLKKEIKVLHRMAKELLEKETLEDDDLRAVFATLKVARS